MITEKTFFSDRDIHITNTRAVFGARTYSMANITSVAMMVKSPNRIPGVVLIVLGLVSFAARNMIFAILLAGLGFYLIVQGKPEYFVQISSSSGEANARSSKDQKYIEEIVDAMNEAIVSRG